ncbi:hypothetical protein GF336_02560 [Candidatus Woesearchaeota archaeon]|nr:hypothetical protein [Candidatus Woesearchaeota archaeon]
MKKIFLIFLFFLPIGCTDVELVNPDISSITLSTDKNLYHSDELMNITASIQSNIESENLILRIYGIYSGRNRLDSSKTINLKKGMNMESIQYKTPRCTGCAGIRPGTYQINAQLKYNNTLIANASKDIDIAQ